MCRGKKVKVLCAEEGVGEEEGKRRRYWEECATDRAAKTSRYLRSMVALAIAEAQEAEDDQTVAAHRPILGLTGEKLAQGFGSAWFYTDDVNHQNATLHGWWTG